MSDGGGLYLNVKPTGAKSWGFVWREGAKRREMGLGAYPAVKLARARALANLGHFIVSLDDVRDELDQTELFQDAPRAGI